MSTPSSPSDSKPSFVARAGTVAGSYRLERRLGAGGMGEVWLGRHQVSGGVAAVKLLHPRVAKRADAATLFAREQSALLRLSHPHIVPVFEVGEAHIAMAYVEGASLARRLRAGITPAHAFRIALQIASALAQAHGRGVLHLDVKPANILVDTAGNAYLADFGASLLVEEAGMADPPVLGTPGYLAPERAYGQPVGPATDQFALGRTLVAALLGTEKLPVWGEEANALPAAIPAEARAVVARAVAVDPNDRFPTLAALEAALAACDLAGLAPHMPLLAPSRGEEAYAWAAHPHAAETLAPDIVRADFRLDALPAEATGRFCAATGLATTAFSLYAHARSLGDRPGPGWLARARSAVVLVHGHTMARECWTDVALALVRDNPDTLVAAFDHTGFGESRYLHDPPAWEHLGYAAVTRAMLAFTELLAIDAFPTVFLGHSLGATGMLLLPDDAFGPHRARILLTPMLKDALHPPPRLLADAFMATLRLASLASKSFYRGYFAWRAGDPGFRELTPERKAMMVDEAVRLPVKTHTRLGQAVAREKVQRGEGFRRTYLVLGVNDQQASQAVCDEAARTLGVRADRFRWLASGGHYPHLETVANPEWTLRNRYELVLLVDEALEEARPTRSRSSELAETEPATPEVAKRGEE